MSNQAGSSINHEGNLVNMNCNNKRQNYVCYVSWKFLTLRKSKASLAQLIPAN